MREIYKQIYVKVPSRTFDEMIEYGLVDKSLDIWFTSLVMEEIEDRKKEMKNV